MVPKKTQRYKIYSRRDKKKMKENWNLNENWECRIDMVYERHYKCYTYRYIIRHNNKTIFKKDFFNHDEEKLEKILKKLQKEQKRG
jgi:hypothetical protein